MFHFSMKYLVILASDVNKIIEVEKTLKFDGNTYTALMALETLLRHANYHNRFLAMMCQKHRKKLSGPGARKAKFFRPMKKGGNMPFREGRFKGHIATDHIQDVTIHHLMSALRQNCQRKGG